MVMSSITISKQIMKIHRRELHRKMLCLILFSVSGDRKNTRKQLYVNRAFYTT